METSRIEVTIAEAGLRAEVAIAPGESGPADDLLAALRAAGVTHGLDQDECRRLAARLRSADFATARAVVARGDPGEPGADGELRLCHEPGQVAGRGRPDGSLDYRERATLHNVAAGERVGRYRPPTAGRPGVTVTGAAIPVAAGRDALPRLGPGVRLDPATGDLVAEHAGVVCHVAGQSLDVTTVWENAGDVDYASGNLQVEGTLHVRGDVQHGFRASATADVIVDGHVRGGRVQAGANVTVRGGVVGEHQGTVVAGGSIACQFANDATLRCEDVVRVGDHCVGSELRGRHVRCEHGRGKLIGGSARALETIHVLEAGSPAGMPTVLAVADLADERARLRRLRRAAQHDERTHSKSGRRTAAAPARAPRSRRSGARLHERLARRRRELQRREDELLGLAEIVVRGTAHPSVLIRFGQHERAVTEPVRSVRFRFDGSTNSISMEEIP